MKKIALCAITTLLILSIAVTPFALAKPGQEKNNAKFLDFDLYIEFASRSEDGTEWRWNPPAVMDNLVPPYSNYLAVPPEGARVLFVENAIWEILPLPFPVERSVSIGGYKIDLNPGDFYSVYDVTWIYEADFGIYDLETTLTIDSPLYSGTITISSIERTWVDYETNLMIGKGTFVGHGIINGQKVQVSGERLVEIDLTFVAPPTMEEKGTIQFLGNPN